MEQDFLFPGKSAENAHPNRQTCAGIIRRSFVREILKATANPEIISDLPSRVPNAKFIPVDQIAEAVQFTLATQREEAIQYCTSEGHPLLRQWIADQYNAAGLRVGADEILITAGSQQGFDLLGKVLLVQAIA